ncbi:MAG: hypothetical protein LBL58_10435 [Tannerellaceae bacterium]|jgi:hypothetical protein|nr:hypothetical protein [Tannerellaceae bacterium]
MKKKITGITSLLSIRPKLDKIMTRNVVLFLFLTGVIVICSCKELKSKEPLEHYSMALTDIVCDDIETMLPGEMYVSGQYLLWTDPFNKEAFVHVVDTKTGKEVGTMIQKGEGPEEFVSPQIDVMTNNQILAYKSGFHFI